MKLPSLPSDIGAIHFMETEVAAIASVARFVGGSGLSKIQNIKYPRCISQISKSLVSSRIYL